MQCYGILGTESTALIATIQPISIVLVPEQNRNRLLFMDQQNAAGSSGSVFSCKNFQVRARNSCFSQTNCSKQHLNVRLCVLIVMQTHQQQRVCMCDARLLQQLSTPRMPCKPSTCMISMIFRI